MRDEEIRNKQSFDKQNYKYQLDMQRKQNEQFRAYGNMSAAEKALNRDDLYAYKEFDGKNYAMIPGIQNQKQINMRRASASGGMTGASAMKQSIGSALGKQVKETSEKLAENETRFKQHGALLGSEQLAGYEPR